MFKNYLLLLLALLLGPSSEQDTLKKTKTFMVVKKIEVVMTVEIPDYENVDLNEYLNATDAIFEKFRLSSDKDGEAIATSACSGGGVCKIDKVTAKDFAENGFVGQVVKFAGGGLPIGAGVIDMNSWAKPGPGKQPQNVVGESNTVEPVDLMALWNETVVGVNVDGKNTHDSKDRFHGGNTVTAPTPIGVPSPATNPNEDLTCVCTEKHLCEPNKIVTMSKNPCMGETVCCAAEHDDSIQSEALSQLIFPNCGILDREKYSDTNKSPWVARVIARTARGRIEFNSVLVHPRMAITTLTDTKDLIDGKTLIKAGQSNTQIRKISKIEKNPHYEKNTINNDLSLMIWEKPLELSADITPACVPHTFDFKNEKCQATYWNTLKDYKKHSEVQMSEGNICSPGTLCAIQGNAECHPNGAPVVCVWPSERVAVVGLIISSTDNKCDTNIKLIDLSLSYPWISDIAFDLM